MGNFLNNYNGLLIFFLYEIYWPTKSDKSTFTLCDEVWEVVSIIGKRDERYIIRMTVKFCHTLDC